VVVLPTQQIGLQPPDQCGQHDAHQHQHDHRDHHSRRFTPRLGFNDQPANTALRTDEFKADSVPFPPLILCTLLAYSVAVAVLQPLLLLFLPVLLVLLPQVCYGWWIKRAIVARRPVYLLFPYFQSVEETMVLAGLVRGYLRFGRMARATEAIAKESSDQHTEVGSV